MAADGTRQGAARRVVFHVGLPKTGTTNFQDTLDLNAEALARHGVAYSRKRDVGKPFRARIRDIVRYGSGGPIGRWRRWRLARAAQDIRRWADAQEHPVVLITDENLLGWRIRDMYTMRFPDGPALAKRALEDAFQGYRIDWVLYSRNAGAHMRSSYRYAVKLRGVADDFETWAARAGSAEALDRLVSDARAAFGASGHHFRMEDEAASGRPWGAPVLALCGLSDAAIAELRRAPKSNVGIPDDLLEEVRALNALGLDKARRHDAVQILMRLYDRTTGATTRTQSWRRDPNDGAP